MRTVTVHIDDVPVTALTDALIAIELAHMKGLFDDEQVERLTPLVLGLRAARDESELLSEDCLAARLTGPDHAATVAGRRRSCRTTRSRRRYGRSTSRR